MEVIIVSDKEGKEIREALAKMEKARELPSHTDDVILEEAVEQLGYIAMDGGPKGSGYLVDAPRIRGALQSYSRKKFVAAQVVLAKLKNWQLSQRYEAEALQTLVAQLERILVQE